MALSPSVRSSDLLLPGARRVPAVAMAQGVDEEEELDPAAEQPGGAAAAQQLPAETRQQEARRSHEAAVEVRA